MKWRVFSVRYPDYQQVTQKTAELITIMGGIGHFVREDETILLQPNLLQNAPNENAISITRGMMSKVG